MAASESATAEDSAGGAGSGTSVTKLFLEVRAHARHGETIGVTGDSMGMGSFKEATVLATDPSLYPVWRTTKPFIVPRGVPVKYKYILFRHGQHVWEPIEGDRTVIPSSRKMTLTDTFGVLDDEEDEEDAARAEAGGTDSPVAHASSRDLEDLSSSRVVRLSTTVSTSSAPAGAGAGVGVGADLSATLTAHAATSASAAAAGASAPSTTDTAAADAASAAAVSPFPPTSPTATAHGPDSAAPSASTPPLSLGRVSGSATSAPATVRGPSPSSSSSSSSSSSLTASAPSAAAPVGGGGAPPAADPSASKGIVPPEGAVLSPIDAKLAQLVRERRMICVTYRLPVLLRRTSLEEGHWVAVWDEENFLARGDVSVADLLDVTWVGFITRECFDRVTPSEGVRLRRGVRGVYDPDAILPRPTVYEDGGNNSPVSLHSHHHHDHREHRDASSSSTSSSSSSSTTTSSLTSGSVGASAADAAGSLHAPASLSRPVHELAPLDAGEHSSPGLGTSPVGPAADNPTMRADQSAHRGAVLATGQRAMEPVDFNALEREEDECLVLSAVDRAAIARALAPLRSFPIFMDEVIHADADEHELRRRERALRKSHGGGGSHPSAIGHLSPSFSAAHVPTSPRLAHLSSSGGGGSGGGSGGGGGSGRTSQSATPLQSALLTSRFVPNSDANTGGAVGASPGLPSMMSPLFRAMSPTPDILTGLRAKLQERLAVLDTVARRRSAEESRERRSSDSGSQDVGSPTARSELDSSSQREPWATDPRTLAAEEEGPDDWWRRRSQQRADDVDYAEDEEDEDDRNMGEDDEDKEDDFDDDDDEYYDDEEEEEDGTGRHDSDSEAERGSDTVRRTRSRAASARFATTDVLGGRSGGRLASFRTPTTPVSGFGGVLGRSGGGVLGLSLEPGSESASSSSSSSSPSSSSATPVSASGAPALVDGHSSHSSSRRADDATASSASAAAGSSFPGGAESAAGASEGMGGGASTASPPSSSSTTSTATATTTVTAAGGMPPVLTPDPSLMEESATQSPKSDLFALFNRYCSTIVRPALHNVLETGGSTIFYPDATAKDSRIDLLRRGWIAYLKVNDVIARLVCAMSQPSDVVWSHDYQLCLVPVLVRKHMARIRLMATTTNSAVGFKWTGIEDPRRIGPGGVPMGDVPTHVRDRLLAALQPPSQIFYMHAPFPTSEIFRTLSARDKLLRGMLAADVIGFHTFAHARHFLQSSRRLLGLAFSSRKGGSIAVDNHGRDVTVTISHIGVEADQLDRFMRTAEAAAYARAIRDKHPNKRIIGGFDACHRLSGVALKFLAFEEYLSNTGASLHRTPSVVLVQRCELHSSRAADIRRTSKELHELAARINDRFGPVVDYEEAIAYPVTARIGLFHAADVLFQTPLREGLNLITLEYVYVRTRWYQQYTEERQARRERRRAAAAQRAALRPAPGGAGSGLSAPLALLSADVLGSSQAHAHLTGSSGSALRSSAGSGLAAAAVPRRSGSSPALHSSSRTALGALSPPRGAQGNPALDMTEVENEEDDEEEDRTKGRRPGHSAASNSPELADSAAREGRTGPSSAPLPSPASLAAATASPASSPSPSASSSPASASTTAATAPGRSGAGVTASPGRLVDMRSMPSFQGVGVPGVARVGAPSGGAAAASEADVKGGKGGRKGSGEDDEGEEEEEKEAMDGVGVPLPPPRRPGCVLLSEFATASHVLNSQLSVNPWHLRDTAHALDAALNMPAEELAARQQRDFDYAIRNSSGNWSRRVLSDLIDEQTSNEAGGVYTDLESNVTDASSHSTVVGRGNAGVELSPLEPAYAIPLFHNARCRVIMLDYAGTLVDRDDRALQYDIGNTNKHAMALVPGVVTALRRLADLPNTYVVVTLGMHACSSDSIHLKELRRVSLASDNGSAISWGEGVLTPAMTDSFAAAAADDDVAGPVAATPSPPDDLSRLATASPATGAVAVYATASDRERPWTRTWMRTNLWEKSSRQRKAWEKAKETVASLMEEYTARVNGSVVRMYDDLVSWDFFHADPEWGQIQSRFLAEELKEHLGSSSVRVRARRTRVDVAPRHMNKGLLADLLIQTLGRVDFFLAIGDDSGDEDLFAKLRSIYAETADPDDDDDDSDAHSAGGSTRAAGAAASAAAASARSAVDTAAATGSSLSGARPAAPRGLGEYLAVTVGRKRTNARFFVNTVWDVHRFLQRLADVELTGGAVRRESTDH